MIWQNAERDNRNTASFKNGEHMTSDQHDHRTSGEVQLCNGSVEQRFALNRATQAAVAHCSLHANSHST